MRIKAISAALAVTAAVAAASVAVADEGMWTFDNFPSAKVKAIYGFAPDKSWLDRVQKASVRLDNGCSASVVSKAGLVLTNHHCVVDCSQNLSSQRNDVVANGFVAAGQKEERVCPGFEASILQSITDVTDRIRNATSNLSPEEVSSARAAAMAAVELEACGDNKTRRCEVVPLYHGGEYKLYRYDRYQDVRLVFAPELQAAFFGGDPDNFNFPRYAFDMGLLRLYRDGKPAVFANPLVVDPAGPTAGQLTFVSGHPGSTERLLSVAELVFQRDHFLPWRIEYLSQLRGSLLTQGTKGEEEARQAQDTLFGLENQVKVYKGQRSALVEPAFFALKVAEENRLRDALKGSVQLQSRYGDPFADIDKTIVAQKGLWMSYQMLERRFGAGSQLLNDARMLVRYAAEQGKPDAERMVEYASSNLASLRQALEAQSAVSPLLEELEIAFWLSKTREYLGADDPAVMDLFGSRTAAEIAHEIATASQLADPAVRARLLKAPAYVMASNDPALLLALRVDRYARSAREAYTAAVGSPLSNASERLAMLRFEVLGHDIYPDATFTLRLSYGAVQGWQDPAFGEIKPFTYLSGLWSRATGAYPFNLAPRWAAAQAQLDGTKQENFVTTNDIIGGNSGSPVLDSQARIVGLAFDGNIHSLGGAYGFDPKLNRMVAVSGQLIVEGLRKVYGAGSLADELSRK
jgi:hypothetical protein